ncbi:alanine racemase [Psittacicella gerlachiana]|uniref:Alanine racemase N-terminal domain-containing protein n=1 Tax=Psittacicella gerlachiana TaxID=2028574 RepID=A0A3A1YCJ1_9GAMM|nr:alanine racemase [Psittacicella gerlachiana]RIY35261.1 hypothetical protein CKF59_03875 [Psittacicella gerlachiana]
MSLQEKLTKNLQEVKKYLASITSQIPKLMVVSKYATTEQLFVHIVNNCLLIGENYVQEAQRKFTSLQLIQIVLQDQDKYQVYFELIKQQDFSKLNSLLDIDFLDQTWQDISFILNYQDQLRNQSFYQQVISNLNSIQLHIIGNVQSRKIDQVAQFAHSIDSISNEKSLLKLAKSLEKYQRSMEILIQLKSNLADGENRAGCTEEEVYKLAEVTSQFPRIKLKGIMFIASTQNQAQEYEKAKAVFKKLKELHPSVQTLSMGMSDSLEIALAHGSTQVRIGSALFK